MSEDESIARNEIFEKIRQLYKLKLAHAKFTPVKNKVQYAGSVFDHEEVNMMVNAILDGWFGVGKYTREFEVKLAKLINVREAMMTNSGSSANLLAVSALLSPQLSDRQRLKHGCEVITPALTFPTTFNPIIQCGLKPVLLDVQVGTYNIRAEDLHQGLSERTKAIMIPHSLGNPNEMDAIMDFAEDHGLYVIEDACDALGSKYDGKMLGSFGTFGTFSFYPAHQITTGEGGAIVSDHEGLLWVARSLRDWGRACACPVCKVSLDPNFFCSLRFQVNEDVPDDYDKRYVYVNIGYNLKPTEIQAAMGIAQIKKLQKFIELRKRNFRTLYEEFERYEDYFILPETQLNGEPCWFAFPLTIQKGAPFKRKDIVSWLNEHNIEVKMMFAGNIIRQPAYKHVKCRIAQPLDNSDLIMRNSFFLGIYPGITEEKMNFILETVRAFICKYK